MNSHEYLGGKVTFFKQDVKWAHSLLPNKSVLGHNCWRPRAAGPQQVCVMGLRGTLLRELGGCD